MKQPLVILILLLLASSCYNYDGPTRPKNTYNTNPYSNGTINNSNSNNQYGSGNSNTSGNNNSGASVSKININQLKSKEYLESLAVAIKRTLPSAQVQILQDSIKVLFPDNILYKSSSVLPKEDITAEMAKLAKLFIKYDKTSVLVTGHTDHLGDKAMNKRLSELRANYISELLKSYGVPSSRVNSWGLGGSSPIASSRVSGGLNKNRRVEFIVLSTVEDN